MDEARQLRIGDDGEDGESGADLAGVKVDRSDGPRRSKHLEHGRADRRGAGVAGLQLVEAAGKLGCEPRLVDLKVLEDSGEVAGRGIEKLGEVVFDLDVVVGTAET